MKKVPVWFVIFVLLLAGLGSFALVWWYEFAQDNPPTRPLTADPTATIQHVEFEGQGNDIVALNVPRSGSVIISAAQAGDGYFAVEIKDSTARYVDLIGNCLDDCQDRTFINLDKGSYILEVSSRANWFIIVTFP